MKVLKRPLAGWRSLADFKGREREKGAKAPLGMTEMEDVYKRQARARGDADSLERLEGLQPRDGKNQRKN